MLITRKIRCDACGTNKHNNIVERQKQGKCAYCIKYCAYVEEGKKRYKIEEDRNLIAIMYYEKSLKKGRCFWRLWKQD